MRTFMFLLVIGAAAMIAGCIVSDQVTTITIQPNGSADWVRFQSNVHSTEKGAKGTEELRRFADEFDAHKDADYVQISDAGGAIVETRWVRSDEPFSTIMIAKFPTWAALQKFWTVTDDKGNVVAQPQFVENGNRRRLTVVVPIPKDDSEKCEAADARTFEKLRQMQADGISETRVAVVGGEIIASQGFTVARDRRSAVLEPAMVEDLIARGGEKLELFLEWELAGGQ